MKKVFLLLALPVLAALLVKVMISSGVLEVMTLPARLLPIYYVDTPEKKLALSFDASWGTQHTPRLLEILQQNNIKTTFFLTGFWVEKYPELVKKIAAAGHELGNHTWTHPHLNTLDKRGIKIELERLQASLTGLTGVPPNLFRPPFGEYSNKVIEAANDLGLLTIQWSIDSLDWKNLSREAIVQRVTSRLHPGAIILFHNNGRYTADALPEIISFAKSQGYTIVPISELLHREDWYIDPADGAQR